MARPHLIMKDRSAEVIALAATILDQSEAALEKARTALPDAFDRTSVAYELLLIHHTADELLEFFDPPIYPIGCFGMPRSRAEMLAEPQLILRSDEGFDFSTWYAEKSASMMQAARSLVSDWRREIENVRLYRKGPSTPEETYVEDLIRNLENARSCAQVIYDMTFKHRVTVKEVRFGPEDSN